MTNNLYHDETHKVLVIGPDYKKSIKCFGRNDAEKIYSRVSASLKTGFSAKLLVIPIER